MMAGHNSGIADIGGGYAIYDDIASWTVVASSGYDVGVSHVLATVRY